MAFLGNPEGLFCLDVGGDNGVISFLLRQQGGYWKSADLDEQSVRSIQELVKTNVYQLSGSTTPFRDQEFDCVIIVDYLEHIQDEAGFIAELSRITKPGGVLIVNVPHSKNSLLRKFRVALGQTDEKHGHLRPGYTRQSLEDLFKGYFTTEAARTYSKFFSEMIDALLVFVISILQRGKKSDVSRKGVIVTGKELKSHQSIFLAYSLIYPIFWFFSKLDHLLFFNEGYMLIARARKKGEEGNK